MSPLKPNFDRYYEPHSSSLRGLSAAFLSAGVYWVTLLVGGGRIFYFPLSTFAWLLPLFVALKEEKSSLVRFHAIQATLLFLLVAPINLTFFFLRGPYSFMWLIRFNPLRNIVLSILNIALTFALPAYASYLCTRAAMLYREFSLPVLGRLAHWLQSRLR